MLALNCRQAAELILQETGRSCTRQNVEQLVKKGRLKESTLAISPIRVDGEKLIAEYLAVVDTRQSQVKGPRPKRTQQGQRPATPAAPLVSASPEKMPDYNESRARSEFEKANLLELERKTKEGLLLKREDVDRAWGDAVAIAKTKLLAVPTRARQRIPHLTLDEIEELTQLIREALQEVADA
jgi:hypothetical protein